LPYVDLEEPGTRARFADDPTAQLELLDRGAVLDEAQTVPELFGSLRGVIDATPRARGRFVLLGSAQPALVRRVSESLAGRVGILELDPLTVAETAPGRPRRDWRALWLAGGFPGALRGAFREWWEAYLRTYVERDLPALGVGANPLLLRRLLTMLAHQQGGIFNASAVGQSLDVSYHTVQRYLDVLEQTFLIRRLAPYFRNVGKRLVKAPKVYLRDTGLLHHLLNLDTLAAVASHPVHGASFETFVIEDLLRRERLAHPHGLAYFWRTATGSEVDLVLDRGNRRLLVEVKAGRGDRGSVGRALEGALRDVDAEAAWIVDQRAGVEAAFPGVERRGVTEMTEWLPATVRSHPGLPAASTRRVRRRSR
jgi:hypothetical protein